MNGRERSLACLNRRPTDRIPIMGGWVLDWKFLEEAAGVPFWEDPTRVAIKAFQNLQVDMMPHLGIPINQKDFRTGDFRAAMEAAERDYRSPEDVKAYVEALPEPARLEREFDLEEAVKEHIKQYSQLQEAVGDDILWVYSYPHCRFMWYGLFGYENYFASLLLYKDTMRKLFEHSAMQSYLGNLAIVEAVKAGEVPPFLYGGQDICTSSGPMVSVGLLEEVYFPNLKQSIKPLVDAGIKIVWHCDGNVTPIAHQLLDCGIEGFQGFEEEYGVDLETMVSLKTKTGQDPLIWGSISVTTTLPRGTVEEVKRDIERCVDICAPHGGFFLNTTSTILPDTPRENIWTFFRYGIEYGAKWCERQRQVR